jgi:hypothetical protein
MENYVKWFQFNLQRSKQSRLYKETLKITLLREIRDDYIDVLNLV